MTLLFSFNNIRKNKFECLKNVVKKINFFLFFPFQNLLLIIMFLYNFTSNNWLKIKSLFNSEYLHLNNQLNELKNVFLKFSKIFEL